MTETFPYLSHFSHRSVYPIISSIADRTKTQHNKLPYWLERDSRTLSWPFWLGWLCASSVGCDVGWVLFIFHCSHWFVHQSHGGLCWCCKCFVLIPTVDVDCQKPTLSIQLSLADFLLSAASLLTMFLSSRAAYITKQSRNNISRQNLLWDTDLSQIQYIVMN